jgi:hypothetical protein
MKKAFLILFIIAITNLFSQVTLSDLKGVWISKKADLFAIQNITNDFEDENIIGKDLKEVNLNVFLRGDIISFQKKYYTEESNFEKSMIDSFDLKVVSKNATSVVLKPYSKSSINFFKTKKNITFTKQDFNIDPSIVFQKIVFHPTGCYGACPIIDLEINKENELYLNGTFFKDFSMFDIDSTLSGQFKGIIDESTQKRLSFLLQTCNLKTLKVNENLEPEMAVTSMIVYFNDEKRAFKFNTTPAILTELVYFLTTINQEVNLNRTNKRRVLETY